MTPTPYLLQFCTWFSRGLQGSLKQTHKGNQIRGCVIRASHHASPSCPRAVLHPAGAVTTARVRGLSRSSGHVCNGSLGCCRNRATSSFCGSTVQSLKLCLALCVLMELTPGDLDCGTENSGLRVISGMPPFVNIHPAPALGIQLIVTPWGVKNML